MFKVENRSLKTARPAFQVIRIVDEQLV